MTSPVAFARHRWLGTYEVDPWGLDRELVDLVAPLVSLRWSFAVTGAETLAEGPALLVYERRLGWSEPLVVAAALHRETGRAVRLVGCTDVAPLGPAQRRLGGVLAHPEEVASLLRSGELVAVPARRHLFGRREAGVAAPELLAPAEALGAPVRPVAVRGHELGRRWRVAVGEAEPRIGSERDVSGADRVAN